MQQPHRNNGDGGGEPPPGDGPGGGDGGGPGSSSAHDGGQRGDKNPDQSTQLNSIGGGDTNPDAPMPDVDNSNLNGNTETDQSI